MDDIVEMGSERQPSGRGPLVVAAVVLAALATLGTVRAMREPSTRDTATRTPRAPVSVPPLETVPVSRLGNLAPDRNAIEAPPAEPADAPDVMFVGRYRITRVHTANDDAAALLDTKDGEMRSGWVPLRDGYATLLAAESDIQIDPVLVVRDGTRTTRTRLDGSVRIVEGGTDTEFWVAHDEVPLEAQRYADGRPAGPRVTLPPGRMLMRGTVAGLLLAPVDDSAGLRVWDPASRRYVLDLPPDANPITLGRRVVVWTTFCGRRTCPVRATDLGTGVVRALPMPPGAAPDYLAGLLDATETAFAFYWGTADDGSGALYTLRFGDARPRRVAELGNQGVLGSWVTPDRLVFVQVLDEQVVVLTWDHEPRRLRQAGVYAIDPFGLEYVVARPRA